MQLCKLSNLVDDHVRQLGHSRGSTRKIVGLMFMPQALSLSIDLIGCLMWSEPRARDARSIWRNEKASWRNHLLHAQASLRSAVDEDLKLTKGRKQAD